MPQRDARARVVASAGGQLHAHQIGLGFVFAAKLQRQNLCAVTGQRLANLSQSKQLAQHIDANIGGRALTHPLTGVFTQGMRDFMAHDHGHLIVSQLQLVQDTAEKSDLAARHTKGVELLGGDHVDLPLPGFGARVPLVGKRNNPRRNRPQAHHLRMSGWQQGPLLIGFTHHLHILLGGGSLNFLGRNQLRKTRIAAHLHAITRRAILRGTGGKPQYQETQKPAHQACANRPAPPRLGV